MAKFLVIFAMLLNVLSYSQNKSIKASYDFNLNLNNQKSNKIATLYVNESKNSLFEYGKLNQDSNTNSNDNEYSNLIIDSSDSIGSFQSINYKNGIITERRIGHNNYYYIVEKLTLPSWVLIDSTKTINSIKCKYAKTHFFGRDYFAWYAPSIPSNSGPWKLAGLPGLIIQASSNDNSVKWNLKDISFSEKIILPITDHGEKSITLSEYFLLKKKNMEKIKKRLNKLSQTNVKVRVEIKDEELEIINFNEN